MEYPAEYAARLERLKKLQKQGIDPYPANVERDHTIAEFLAQFDKLIKGDPISDASEGDPISDASEIGSLNIVNLVGRVRSLRPHGGSAFAHIEDGSGQAQIYMQKDTIGAENYDHLLDSLDVGDFVAASGKPYVTKRGEKSLLVQHSHIISKALLPLPEKWHGLTDTEARYRKRYLDLIMNKEVRENLILRSRLVSKLREFMDQHGYLEVQTPILQPIYGGGFARPFKTHHNALDADMYLRISNEMYLKRLIVGGFEKVYELSTDFRNEGIDHTHNPEFTIMEAMTAYENYFYGMDLIEGLTEFLAKEILGKTTLKYEDKEINLGRPWKRVTMVEAIQKVTGINALELDEKALRKEIISQKIEKVEPRAPARGGTPHRKPAYIRAEPGLSGAWDKIKQCSSWGALVALLFEEKVEETLIQPTMIYNFPTEVTPLAKKCVDDPRFTESFEQYINGWEIGNNYTEINDPTDLQKRFIAEKNRAKAGFEEAHQTDEDYLEAIMHGMPPTVGIATSIDRLTMLFTNNHSIKEVIAFPTLKPLDKK